MKGYNIYYKSERINDYPIDKKVLQEVMEKQYIYKKNKFNNEVIKIPTTQIVTRMCTIV